MAIWFLIFFGSNLSKMDQNGSKWIKMDQNGSKWIKLDQICSSHQSKYVTIKSCHIHHDNKLFQLFLDQIRWNLSENGSKKVKFYQIQHNLTEAFLVILYRIFHLLYILQNLNFNVNVVKVVKESNIIILFNLVNAKYLVKNQLILYISYQIKAI